MGEDRQEVHLCPFYLYEEVKDLGGLSLDRQFYITEALQNDVDENVWVGPIVRPAEFPGSA